MKEIRSAEADIREAHKKTSEKSKVFFIITLIHKISGSVFFLIVLKSTSSDLLNIFPELFLL